jgi:15-cis-phytoene synthase/lycopene beta-cyclase
MWDALFLGVPITILWVTQWRILRRYKRTVGSCVLAALVFSIPWDGWAIKSEIWKFPATTNLGIRLGVFPLEEIVFYIGATILLSSLTLVLRNHFAMKLVDQEILAPGGDEVEESE